jgi:putative membrane protein
MRTILAAGILLLSSATIVKATEIEPRTFAEKVAVSDIFEIQAAKLEFENGKSTKIKAFASDMIKDHGESTAKLKTAAANDGVALPMRLDADHQKKLDALKPLKGVELDAAYASTQITVHTAAVAVFDAYSKNGKGGALKAFAQQTYPVIRQHLVRIQGLNSGE